MCYMMTVYSFLKGQFLNKTMWNNIRFENETGYLYAEQEIAALEQLLGARFPDDFRSYMSARGTQKIEFDHRYFLLDLDGFLAIMQYNNFEHQAFFKNRCLEYKAKSGEYDFESDKAKYVPFASADQTSVTKHGIFRLFISLNKDNFGTVWAAHDCYNDEQKEVYFVAESFTAFLKQVTSHQVYSQQVMDNNNKLFNTWLIDYEQNSAVAYPEFESMEAFAEMLLDRPHMLLVNPGRRLEYLRWEYCSEYRNHSTFYQGIKSFTDYQPQLMSYSHINKVESQGLYKFPGLDVPDHHYFSTWVSGILSNGTKCDQTFVLYRDPTTKCYSLIVDKETRFESIKIKGLGTFDYDGSVWSLTRKKKPKWSPLPCSVVIRDSKSLFSSENVSFIQESFNNAKLKQTIENSVYKQYQDVDYPDYVNADPDERLRLRDCYPNIASEEEIWQLLGKALRLSFNLEQKVLSVHADYLPDYEHGISIETIKL